MLPGSRKQETQHASDEDLYGSVVLCNAVRIAVLPDSSISWNKTSAALLTGRCCRREGERKERKPAA